MSRYDIYHTHTRALIGTADTIEQAILIGEEKGCRDNYCPCRRYIIYDTVLKTDDVTEMVKERIKREK